MKFSITSSNEGSPCGEAYEIKATYLDYRTVKTLKEAETKSHWYKQWFYRGVNHREDANKEMIVCDVLDQPVWIIELFTLEGLLDFSRKHGYVEISSDVEYKKLDGKISLN